MAKLDQNSYTYLNEREIAGSGLATSPTGIAWVNDIQRAVLSDQPADTQAARDAAAAAATQAGAAQASATDAGARADAAQSRADAAYTLAGGKVTKTTVVAPSGYTATAATTYTQADEQALRDQVAALTTAVQAIVAALKV